MYGSVCGSINVSERAPSTPRVHTFLLVYFILFYFPFIFICGSGDVPNFSRIQHRPLMHGNERRLVARMGISLVYLFLGGCFCRKDIWLHSVSSLHSYQNRSPTTPQLQYDTVR
jgi:hypothetical protein